MIYVCFDAFLIYFKLNFNFPSINYKTQNTHIYTHYILFLYIYTKNICL